MRQLLLEIVALQELLRLMRTWAATLGEESDVARAFMAQEAAAMACLEARVAQAEMV